MSWFYYLAIILIFGLLMGKVVSYLKLPRVTGYLIAGVLIGPFVLKLVPHEAIESLTIISEAALGFMLPARFMCFLLASFQRKQSLCVTAALVGALAGVTLFSIPVAILAGIVCGCLTALIQAFWQGAPDEL